MTGTHIPGMGLQIRRGDERFSRSLSSIGPRKWFCQLHGHQRAVYVLTDGETYAACQECLWTSPLIPLGEAEDLEETSDV